MCKFSYRYWYWVILVGPQAIEWLGFVSGEGVGTEVDHALGYTMAEGRAHFWTRAEPT